MPIPTLFQHYQEDRQLTQRRFKFDLVVSLVAIIVVLLVAIASIVDLLTKTTYEGICADENITPKMLCDDWSFRQCSYFGNTVGTKASSSRRRLSGDPPNNGGNPPNDGGNPPNDGGNPPNDGGNPPNDGGNPPNDGGNPPNDGGDANNGAGDANNQNQVVGGMSLTKEECEISQGGGCPAFDVTSRNFCTNYKGGNMDEDGILYTYLWTSETEVEFSEAPAGKGAVICCGQIVHAAIGKLVMWLGIMGGAIGAIVKGVVSVGNVAGNMCFGVDGKVEDGRLQRLESSGPRTNV